MAAYQEQDTDLQDFNKELQWTLLQMKRDNDILKQNLEYVAQGGNPDEIKKTGQYYESPNNAPD